MLTKYIDLGAPVSGWGPPVQLVHPSTMTKIASESYTPKELLEVMDGLKPREDGVYVLLNALGAGEYIGQNKNGDYFPEWSLRGDEPPKGVRKLYESKGLEIPDQSLYGHKTFVTDAHVFVGHNNKDPQFSVGNVVASAYNDKMHRAELVAFIDGTKQAEAVARIQNGEQVPFSMGAKLRTDQCSVCLNAARTRDEYCGHLKYAMNQILPDGRKVYAYNFFPKFFDISIVRVPADSTAWSLKKVASAQEEITPPKFIGDPNHTKFSSFDLNTNLNKETKHIPLDSNLVKFLRGVTKIAVQRPTNLKIVDGIKKHGAAILPNLTLMGIILNNEEASLLYSNNQCPKTFSMSDIDYKFIRTNTGLIKEASLFDPHFTRRMLDLKETNSGAEYPAAYVSYLKSINLNEFTHKVDNDPVVLMSTDVETCLNKVAGLNDSPIWLPFVVGITIL